MSDRLIVLSTFPDADSARKTAATLVRERLAACVQVLPQMTSFYEWQGEAASDPEHLVLIKTTASRYAALEVALRANHPYELPEIVATPIVRGLGGYLDWLDAQTTPATEQ